MFLKFTNVSILVASILTAGVTQAHANDELNSEINDLQVQIIRKDSKAPARLSSPQPQPEAQYQQAPQVVRPRRQVYLKPVPRPTVVAAQTMATPNGTTSFYDHTPVSSPRYAYNQPTQAPGTSYSTTQDQPTAPRNPFRRIEFLPAVAITSFDGQDAGQLQPSGLSNTSNTSFAGSFLTDISFGSNNFVIETGLSALQLGGTVGYAAGNGFVNSTAYAEKVGLTYIGVPVDLKWLVSGEGNSSVYVKGGVMPTYLAQHSYASSTNINAEYRFGGYHLFDAMVTAGIGYDLRVYKDIHVVIDLSVFQGTLPVLDNFNVYNYGALGGIGIAYAL